MFLKKKIYKSTESYSENIERLKEEIENADAIVIGAGAGLSTAAGYAYSGKRFDKYFFDFKDKYGIKDMYSGGFYPFPNLETYWAWWARQIYVNRYDQSENEIYKNLLHLVKDKDYFVITTNVDHQFQLSGFDKKRLFYTQGDYGLWQCSSPCHKKTYDNETQVRKMLIKTGFIVEKEDAFEIADSSDWKMEIPAELIPYCPRCGKPMTMNLRCDDTFIQDVGWYTAKERYEKFIEKIENRKVLYLELGVGGNTPVWIKYPFWKMTKENPKATYASLNLEEAYAPDYIGERSICLKGDIGEALREIINKI